MLLNGVDDLVTEDTEKVEVLSAIISSAIISSSMCINFISVKLYKVQLKQNFSKLN